MSWKVSRNQKRILYEGVTLAKNTTEASFTFKSNGFIIKAMSMYTNKKFIYFYKYIENNYTVVL